MIAFREATDAALLGDDEHPDASFAVFYRRHAVAIVRFAASRGLDADTAADVVAETFVAALAGRKDYRPQHDTARLWLLGIAARKLVDVHRRTTLDRVRQERLERRAVALTGDDRDSYERVLAEDRGDAFAALADLPEAQRQAVRARIVEDRAYADIARELGLTEPTARQHVSRGLAALRTRLGKSL